MLKTWLNLSMLAVECQSVVAMRMLRLAAGGPKADKEAWRMASEKAAAAMEAAGMVMLGGDADKVIRGYRRHVRRNRRRLRR
jgi:hypothetical protein